MRERESVCVFCTQRDSNPGLRRRSSLNVWSILSRSSLSANICHWSVCLSPVWWIWTRQWTRDNPHQCIWAADSDPDKRRRTAELNGSEPRRWTSHTPEHPSHTLTHIKRTKHLKYTTQRIKLPENPFSLVSSSRDWGARASDQSEKPLETKLRLFWTLVISSLAILCQFNTITCLFSNYVVWLKTQLTSRLNIAAVQFERTDLITLRKIVVFIHSYAHFCFKCTLYIISAVA